MKFTSSFTSVRHVWKYLLPGIICFTSMIIAQTGMAENRYAGSKACKECHEEAYANFSKYAKKAHSFEAIKKMRDHLSQDEIKSCYACHTTGYGEPGGFTNEHDTPQLANAGCEVCHGPGSRHIESEDSDDIIGTGRLSKERCEKCHSKDRIKAFNFKPLLHGGAH